MEKVRLEYKKADGMLMKVVNNRSGNAYQNTFLIYLEVGVEGSSCGAAQSQQ